MGKFVEADNRIFKNVFVCKKCKSVVKTQPLKVKLGKSKCRKCSSKALRLKHKEKKA